MRVYLVRHGETAMNRQGLAMGQLDVDLNEEGQRQLPLLEERFRSIRVDKIFSSDLHRAQLTAQAVSRGCGAPVTVMRELRERSFGQWEGTDYGEVTRSLIAMSRDQGVPLYEVRPPGGESHHDIWNRTLPVIQPLFGSEQDTVIVSHGGACRVMLSQLLRATLDSTFCFKFDNTSVTRLDKRPDGSFLLSLYNDTAHVCVLSETEPILRGTT
jgi:broad specificity phosphatase PhoE